MSLWHGPSVNDLPDTLYQWTLENYPDYLHPPRNYSTPNLTSWRVFKGIIDERRENGEDDIQVPEQPEMSEEKPPYLDSDLLSLLESFGLITSTFQGTSYYVFGKLETTNQAYIACVIELPTRLRAEKYPTRAYSKYKIKALVGTQLPRFEPMFLFPSSSAKSKADI